MDKRDFFRNYDLLMPHYCEPYKKFLNIGASAIPKNAKSILELGIGTGNFSLEVQKRIPEIKIQGIDLDESLLQKTKEKIPSAKIYQRDIVENNYPRTDYIISSLATHHFPTQTRKKTLLQIARHSKGFVNFDLVVFPNQTFEEVIKKCLGFSRKYFSKKELKKIEEEMRRNDNPMPLEEVEELFNSNEFKFEILAKQSPYVVYKVFSNSK